MICVHCRQGADLLRNVARTPALVGAARLVHTRCRGGTWCDCQHRVEMIVTVAGAYARA